MDISAKEVTMMMNIRKKKSDIGPIHRLGIMYKRKKWRPTESLSKRKGNNKTTF